MFLTVLMLSYNVSLLARFSLNIQMLDVKVRDDICLLYFRQLQHNASQVITGLSKKTLQCSYIVVVILNYKQIMT